MNLNMTDNSSFRQITSPGNTTLHTKETLVTFHVCFLALAALIVIVNSLVLIVYFRAAQLHTNNNFLLISLTFTDLFAGALNIPFISLPALIAHRGRSSIAIHFIGNVLSDFSVIVNELNLFLIFLDRYLIICHPIASRKLITRRRILNFIALSWVVATFVAVVPLAWCFKVVAGENASAVYRSKMLKRISQHSISLSMSCFMLPSLVMLYFLVAMIYSINEHKKKRKRLTSSRGSTRRLSKHIFNSYVKAFCMLLSMYVLMLIAWSPLMIVRLCLDFNINININSELFHALMIFRFITALINPFIYTFIKKEFQHAFVQKLRLC